MQNKYNYLLLALAILLLIALLLNLSFGAVAIPFKNVIGSLLGNDSGKESWNYIILEYRLPKAITAILAGMGLAISGLLMQTMFRNPLAGPFVLGLSSGSSLGVALLIMGSGLLPTLVSGLLLSQYGIILASSIGSFSVLLLVLAVSQKLRDTSSILIVGLMFGSFTSAFVSVLTYFSTAEQLQKFSFWSMGNLGNLTWESIIILTIFTIIGLILSVISLKSLDAMLLGENYAQSLGLNYKKSRLIIILGTSILTGCITAFVGPIAFIGLAVPHIAKLIFNTSNHKILFLSTLLIGAIALLICDLLTHIPNSDVILPINAVTSVFGAPIVIYLLLNKNKLTI